jgi:GTP diphosphokinase / guanosine-3',5'-bis(diphosphate) 3'-diphosphatase
VRVSDLELMMRAAAFASAQHRDQRRKDAAASPYVNHLIEVVSILALEGGVTDGPLLAAGWLHDVVEDTSTGLDAVRGLFGDGVADLVDEVSDDKALPKQRRKDLQVSHAAHASPRGKQLKLADKIANVRDLGRGMPKGWSTERCVEYVAWAQAVVAGLRGANAGLERAFDAAAAATLESLS